MKIFFAGILFIGLVLVIVLSVCQPQVLGDKNSFLKDFINHEILNILGIILAITLASAAQLHLKFNEIEERAGKEILSESRKEVKSNALWLIYLFVVAMILVLIKSYF